MYLAIEDTYQPRSPAAHATGNEPSHKRPAVSHKPLRRGREKIAAAVMQHLADRYHIVTIWPLNLLCAMSR